MTKKIPTHSQISLSLSLTLRLVSSAGAQELTSLSQQERRRRRFTTHARLKTIDGVDGDGVESKASGAMEQNKRINSSIVKSRSVEAEAATKIQASFRGYQVRKQLKQKVSGTIHF